MFYPIGFGGQHWFLYLIVPAILGIWAQIRVTGAFNRWGKVRASSNITGAECAREILQAAQIHDVDVVETNDFLGDHYDPTKKKLCLSTNVYNSPAVAAVGLAARENYSATNAHRAARRSSRRGEQRAQRRRADLRRGLHRRAGQLALVDVDARPARLIARLEEDESCDRVTASSTPDRFVVVRVGCRC